MESKSKEGSEYKTTVYQVTVVCSKRQIVKLERLTETDRNYLPINLPK